MSLKRWQVIMSAVCVLVGVILLAQMASRADPPSCSGTNCTVGCKEHDRWCKTSNGHGWRTYSKSPQLHGVEENTIEVAYEGWCIVNADSGSATENDTQWYWYWDECEPDCTTDQSTTGAPDGDTIGNAANDTFKMVCSDS